MWKLGNPPEALRQFWEITAGVCGKRQDVVESLAGTFKGTLGSRCQGGREDLPGHFHGGQGYLGEVVRM